jgi:hypothetical protein
VTYAVVPLFDTSKPVHAGAALPIKLEVTDAAGNAQTGLTLTAVSIVDANGNKFTPKAKGNANPGNVFRKVGFGYIYNLDTTGLAPGTYSLLVQVGSDPVLHAVSFVIADPASARCRDAFWSAFREDHDSDGFHHRWRHWE